MKLPSEHIKSDHPMDIIIHLIILCKPIFLITHTHTETLTVLVIEDENLSFISVFCSELRTVKKRIEWCSNPSLRGFIAEYVCYKWEIEKQPEKYTKKT
ncbi:hypothetical protein T4D_11549 [Trichinella pseudospiralis]|uniref:Uncharacterized protein n=1 Tax=Trichinella pseudospiralis TaxID=6337 RepID=A0A0V1FXC6_TRIPS|nr:hypothetical protein T4D_11549 [Trichinella pseudospiralis]